MLALEIAQRDVFSSAMARGEAVIIKSGQRLRF